VLGGGLTAGVPLQDGHDDQKESDGTDDGEDQDNTWLAGSEVVALEDDRHSSGLKKLVRSVKCFL